MILSMMGMTMDKGAWLDVRCHSGWMECWLILLDPYLRNIRSMVELASPIVSEYLVGQGLVGVKRAKL